MALSRGLFRPAALEPLAAGFLVLLAVGVTLHHVRDDAATTDEPVHVASSVEIARQGTGRWNPEHPPLAKALAGLSLTGLAIDPAPSPLLTRSHAPLLVRFLFRNLVPGERMLFRARLPFALVLAALLLAVRAEARRRFGAGVGLFALALAALDPNLLAHAGVVHTDLLVTLFVVLSLRPLDRLREPSARLSGVLLGLCWGLALLSKFSAPLLSLVTLPLLLVRGRPRGEELRRIGGRLCVAAAVSLAVALAGYAAAHRNLSPADARALAEDRLLGKGGSPAAYRASAALADVLPPASHLATGFLSVVLQSRVGAGPVYLLGRVSTGGSPLYFPLALAVKVPIGLALAALAGSLSRPGRRTALALSAGVLLFLLASTRTSYNIGVRHALFAFPFAALAASALLGGGPPRRARLLAAGLVAVSAAELALVHPHELSFVNAAAGGLPAGRRYFADSNVDWGQDLLRLARLAPELSAGPLPAVVFGGDLPSRHAPALAPVAPGDEDRPGRLIAVGEVPLAVGPELLASKGATMDAERLARLREALRSRGTRVAAIGGSIGIWRIDRPPAPADRPAVAAPAPEVSPPGTARGSGGPPP